MQTCHPQRRELVAQLDYVANSVRAINQFVETGPTDKRQQRRENQNNPESQSQLHVDADIRKAAIHKIPLTCLFIRAEKTEDLFLSNRNLRQMTIDPATVKLDKK
ncbi:hypothetical protein [Pseudomonas sp.]|uniref:hypothetical protein n=1 Tax=Pseudomonas sp. TaxID=306 RepID=UPI0039C8D764